MAGLNLLGMDDTSLAQICGEMFCFFTDDSSQLLFAAGALLLYLLLNIVQRFSIRFKSADKLGQVIVSTFSFFTDCFLIHLGADFHSRYGGTGDSDCVSV